MKIGELATATGTPIDTIRFYEREGLMHAAARTEGNYRIYTKAHAERLSFVRHCRALDMTLDEIRLLLRFKDSPDENCGEVNALLDAHIGHVAARLNELRDLERELKRLRTQCRTAQDAAHCGILADLSRPSAHQAVGSATHRDLHVPGPICEAAPNPRSRKR
ncbi:Cd(II)/Pb(II)-responsive transcriptional regulator [Niveibacterium sp. SC-1]|uniref:Cd(II)/Pb(II)-responsive transcriptional regulator n=1 Tax=Niveibacterium sp. SC-1 TaxID=3135646 RepID=UPI00311E28AD